jgi:hypothetical protein
MRRATPWNGVTEDRETASGKRSGAELEELNLRLKLRGEVTSRQSLHAVRSQAEPGNERNCKLMVRKGESDANADGG